jgi:co-chaperonin GroES (HSP10)
MNKALDMVEREKRPIVNEAGLTPCGHRILIKVDEVERTTEGGIVIPDSLADKEEMATIKATVIAIGPGAWLDTHGGPWAEVGQKVMIAKFAGQLWKRGNTKYRVISDLDVIAVIQEE